MFTNSIILDLLGIIIAFTVITITYIKWKFNYWKNRNIPFMNKNLQRYSPGENTAIITKKFYDEVKANKMKFVGCFAVLQPRFFVTDLDLLRHILTKDFEYFTDRGMYCNEKDDPLNLHLFNLAGQKWRTLRMKLTPTFTSGKMRYMFPILTGCGQLLEDLLNEKCEKKEVIDMKEVLVGFTTDIIGSCAFGLECNTFNNPDSPFRVNGKKILNFDVWRIITYLFATHFPTIGKALHITTTPKDITKFFLNVVKETVYFREKNNVIRNDFLQLLIDLKNNNEALQTEGVNEEPFGLKELAAQCFVFYVAGYETSSTLMSFASYELALHQDMQERVRNEIRTVLKKYNDEVTYDSIKEMTYLEQVLEETLRKYPPIPVLHRMCVKDYKIPDTEYIIEKGTKLWISIYGIQQDPEHYPDPDKFDPERFSEENKRIRHSYAYLPFGEGPRICIGVRFSMMQSKIGMISILRNHKITLNSKTKQPMQFGPTFVLSVDGGVWVNLEKC